MTSPSKWGGAVDCPSCGHIYSRVYTTVKRRRTRICSRCAHKFITYEVNADEHEDIPTRPERRKVVKRMHYTPKQWAMKDFNRESIERIKNDAHRANR